jgi:hypothetical protein
MNLLSNRFFYFSLFITFGVIAKGIHSSFRKRRIAKLFASRHTVPLADFGTSFFSPEHAPVAMKVRQLLESIMGIDLGGLRPDDRFSRDLKFGEMSRDAFQKFLGAVEEAYDIDVPDVASCMKLTFAEFVDVVCKKSSDSRATESPDAP